MRHCRPVSPKQRFLLRTRPRLDPSLSVESFDSGAKRLGPHQRHRPAARGEIAETRHVDVGPSGAPDDRCDRYSIGHRRSGGHIPRRTSAPPSHVPRLRSGRTERATPPPLAGEGRFSPAAPSPAPHALAMSMLPAWRSFSAAITRPMSFTDAAPSLGRDRVDRRRRLRPRSSAGEGSVRSPPLRRPRSRRARGGRPFRTSRSIRGAA